AHARRHHHSGSGLHCAGRADPVLRDHRRAPGLSGYGFDPAYMDPPGCCSVRRFLPRGRPVYSGADLWLRDHRLSADLICGRYFVPVPALAEGETQVIETKQLSKRYGDALVLDHVDLRIPEGGVTSIIGANGAGKSTLLTAIAR